MRIRTFIAALAALAALLFTSSSASAGPNPDWAAKFEGQSAYLTLESGQFAHSQFSARNVGAQTWDRSFVNLATVNQGYHPTEARVSPFHVPGSWLTPDRPGRLDQATVPPNSIGTFSFKIRAPQVQTPTDYGEHFAPVAEGRAWMGCTGCQWDGVWLRYTVYPPQDPTLSILPGSRTVVKGEPISLTAIAGDNVALNRVEFVLGEQRVVATNAPYAASFPSEGLPLGANVVTVKAFDNAGRSRTETATFNVKAPTLADPAGVGVTINGGAQFTKTPLVELRLSPPPGATGATIANDGLSNKTVIDLTGERTVAWRLSSSGEERLPKTVYVHFTGEDVDAAKQHTDDIILDEKAPIVSKARVVAHRRGNRKPRAVAAGSLRKPRCSRTPLRLSVRAADNLSGVQTLKYRFNGRGSGRSMGFSSSIPLMVPPTIKSPRSVDVTVADAAGNLSKQRRVSLRRVCR